MIGRLRKWLVDNKIDKDGAPDRKIVITLEVHFSKDTTNELSELTDEDVLVVDLKKQQLSMGV